MRSRTDLVGLLLGCSTFATANTCVGQLLSSLFSDCCRQVKLITEPQLALGAFCPVGLEQLESEYAYSTLNLDQCLNAELGSSIPWTAGMQNLTSGCDTSSFTLDNSTLRGTCQGNERSVDLAQILRDATDTTIHSYFYSNVGRLYCDTVKATTWNLGAFDKTCTEISIQDHPYPNIPNGRPVLRALCDRHAFNSPTDLVLEERYFYSHVDVMDCIARSVNAFRDDDFAQRTCPDMKLNNATLQLSLECEPVDSAPDEPTEYTFNLAELVHNRHGLLACWDLVGMREPVVTPRVHTTTMEIVVTFAPEPNYTPPPTYTVPPGGMRPGELVTVTSVLTSTKDVGRGSSFANGSLTTVVAVAQSSTVNSV